jgi:prepilin-type N-terminal cleavage/methylation domain-containing protein
MKKESTMKKNGFSLIELMVVIIVMGILATIAWPYVVNKRDRAREAATKNNMHTLQLAAEDFATMCDGLYPAVPTTSVMTILNQIVPGSSTNPKRIADVCPGTRANVSTSANALLPGHQTFSNPFLATGNSLDNIAWAGLPVAPAHVSIAAGASGSGTTYWHASGGTSVGVHGECLGYAIYGDGKYSMLYYELRSMR